MSAKASGLVWERSRAKGGSLLVVAVQRNRKRFQWNRISDVAKPEKSRFAYKEDPLVDPLVEERAAAAAPSPLTGDDSASAHDAPAAAEVPLQSADPLDAFRLAWNELTTEPIPRCISLTKERRRWIRAALVERSLEAWREIFMRVEASAHCRGGGRDGWRVTLDWLVRKPDNALRVLEGQYDSSGRHRGSQSVPLAPAALDEELQLRRSLPAHLARILARLREPAPAVVAAPSLAQQFGFVAEKLGQIDVADADNQQQAVVRLRDIEAELLAAAHRAIDQTELAALMREAEAELKAFRAGVTAEVFAQMRGAAVDRLVRVRFNLPLLAWDGERSHAA